MSAAIELAALRAYLDAFGRHPGGTYSALATDDQTRIDAYVRAVVEPYIEEVDEMTATLENEVKRLQSAISAIHDRLHADDVNGAHELCECAIHGESVTQPNLSEEDGADVIVFASAFNALADRHGMMACCITLVPSATVRGAVSLQLSGNVTACRVVEEQIRGKASTYIGDHK